MSRLREYKNHDEKFEWFDDIEVINEPRKLDAFLESLDDINNSVSVFRGITSSKYKMFNSAQRVFINQQLHTCFDDYSIFVVDLVTNFKTNNPSIETFFNNLGIPLNDIPLLAFMQHYGAPTPLLDWTYNPLVALFFATDKAYYSPSNNNSP